MRSAAYSFIISQLEHSATNLGRSMAGERVTYAETGTEIVGDAVDALNSAMAGEVIGHFRQQLVGDVTTFATREIARGNLTSGMSVAISNSQLESAASDALIWIINSQIALMRRLLRQCAGAGNARAYARLFAEALMQDRSFRRYLEERITSYS